MTRYPMLAFCAVLNMLLAGWMFAVVLYGVQPVPVFLAMGLANFGLAALNTGNALAARDTARRRQAG